jgi:hypothetical protein
LQSLRTQRADHVVSVEFHAGEPVSDSSIVQPSILAGDGTQGLVEAEELDQLRLAQAVGSFRNR